jgi:hypothetical protein
MRNVVPFHVAAAVLLGCAACYHSPTAKLAPGTLVRVTAPAAGLERDTMYVLSGDTGTLVVGLPRYVPDDPVPLLDTSRTALRLADVRALEVRVRTTNRSVGMFLGAVGGMLAGKNLGKDPWDNDCELLCPLFGLIRIFGGGVVGMSVGAFVGAQFPRDDWYALPAGRVSVGVRALPAGRLGVGAAVGF